MNVQLYRKHLMWSQMDAISRDPSKPNFDLGGPKVKLTFK